MPLFAQWIAGKAKDDKGASKVHIIGESYLCGLGGKTTCGLIIDPYFWTHIKGEMKEFIVAEKCPECFGEVA